MRVTIGGPPGSGKTTVAKIVSTELRYTHIYTGDIFRNLAKGRGMPLGDFSRLAEKDNSIDIEVDRRQKELGIKNNIILEGRMARFMIVPDLSVWITAPFEERVRRISQRENLAYDVAFKDTEKREKSEKGELFVRASPVRKQAFVRAALVKAAPCCKYHWKNEKD